MRVKKDETLNVLVFYLTWNSDILFNLAASYFKWFKKCYAKSFQH